MSYRDDFGASLAQNKVLADELKKAQKRIEKTGPREIPNLDDVMLEFLMGWEGQVIWTKSGWTILATDFYDGDTKDPKFGIAFRPLRKKVKIIVAEKIYQEWCEFRDLHLVKGDKAKVLKDALVYYYINRKRKND
jgi:hypothetical protein